ncbi:MAG: exodeoxyribonuclease III [Candidatus Makaraimicrobium thalassicum]|nr:MAG: exodeoxyribonuclease III [Candidatus Omnitrophota bacterium]
MRILSWNVNGIRSAADKGFLGWLLRESPDIVCLQETKARPEQLQQDLAAPQGYLTYWNNPERKGYAGVAVLTRGKPVSVKKDFLSGSFDPEGRALVLYFKDFVLINVYFPNGRMGPDRLKYKLDFYERFLKSVRRMKDRNVVVCGDFNTAHKEIDLARPGDNEMFSGFLPAEREWMDRFSRGYVDTFRHFNKEGGHYTWWDYKNRARGSNMGWRIDYFFVTKGLLPRVKTAFIMPDVQGSDHCPIGIELSAKGT